MDSNPNRHEIGFFTLPRKLRTSIYTLALSAQVELAVDAQGSLSPSLCRLLRINNRFRSDLLASCRKSSSDEGLQLVYTLQTPSALEALLPYLRSESTHPVRNLRVVFLADLDGVDARQYDDQAFVTGDAPPMAPFFERWRATFRAMPQNTSLRSVYFDFKRSFEVHPCAVATRVHLFSAVLRQRSGGRARVHILGSGRMEFQRYLEGATVGVVPKYWSQLVGTGGQDLRTKRARRGLGESAESEASVVEDDGRSWMGVFMPRMNMSWVLG